MFLERFADQTALLARIDELERRVAQLEQQPRESRPHEPATAPSAQGEPTALDEGPELPEDDRRDRSELRFGRRATDRFHRASRLDDGDAGREAARMVALEMLGAGHRPENVEVYLRETFDLDEESARLALSERS